MSRDRDANGSAVRHDGIPNLSLTVRKLWKTQWEIGLFGGNVQAARVASLDGNDSRSNKIPNIWHTEKSSGTWILATICPLAYLCTSFYSFACRSSALLITHRKQWKTSEKKNRPGAKIREGRAFSDSLCLKSVMDWVWAGRPEVGPRWRWPLDGFNNCMVWCLMSPLDPGGRYRTFASPHVICPRRLCSPFMSYRAKVRMKVSLERGPVHHVHRYARTTRTMHLLKLDQGMEDAVWKLDLETSLKTEVNNDCSGQGPWLVLWL